MDDLEQLNKMLEEISESIKKTTEELSRINAELDRLSPVVKQLPYDMSSIPRPCRTCSNHPINGGSGMCNCILGGMNNITW